MSSFAIRDSPRDQPKINGDLKDVAQAVHQQFDELLNPQLVDECLNRVAAKFDHAKVRSFVPLLVRRYVSDELQERLDPCGPAA